MIPIKCAIPFRRGPKILCEKIVKCVLGGPRDLDKSGFNLHLVKGVFYLEQNLVDQKKKKKQSNCSCWSVRSLLIVCKKVIPLEFKKFLIVKKNFNI